MKILGLIPARGGSKGIKNKNIIDLAGRPLISYAINALNKANLVDRIVCTTDSPKIARVARRCGAEVSFLRPKEIAQDNSPVFPALIHAVKKLEEIDDYKPDFIVTIQPTSPFVESGQIDGAVAMAIEKKADSVVTVVDLGNPCHPYSIREILPGGKTKFWMEKEHYKFPDRQSRPKFYKFGNLFVTHYDTLVGMGRVEGRNNYVYKVDKFFCFDIDDPSDLVMAEMLMKTRGLPK